MRAMVLPIAVLALSLSSVEVASAERARARTRAFKLLKSPVQSFRSGKARLGERVGQTRLGQRWNKLNPKTRKWIKRGGKVALGLAAVTAAPYVLGATGTVLSGAGHAASSLGNAGLVRGASALAGKGLAAGGFVLGKGAAMAGGYALKNAVPLAIGGAIAARWAKKRAGRAQGAPLAPPQPGTLVKVGSALEKR